MKKIFKLIRRWRTRRIFNHWLIFYLKQGATPTEAIHNALKIFEWLSPNLEIFSDWYLREYRGISNHTPCAEHEQQTASDQ